MRVQFLREFGGEATGGVTYAAGEVADLPDAAAAALIRRGRVIVPLAEGADPAPLPAATATRTEGDAINRLAPPGGKHGDPPPRPLTDGEKMARAMARDAALCRAATRHDPDTPWRPG